MIFEQLRQRISGRRDVLGDTLRAIDGKIGERAPLREMLGELDRARKPLRDELARRLHDGAAATALTLKVLNLLLAKYHFRQRSANLISRPFGMLIDPANGCNLACPGCVQSEPAKLLRVFDWQNGMLPAGKFGALLERYGPYAMQIMFCNYGEPLLNPNTPQLIRMAKDYRIQTALSTNLSVPRLDADAYVNSGLDFMLLAIDGASQEVYGRYRKRGDLAVVYRNAESLVAAKRRLGRRAPILRWQFLAFEHNAHEIPAARAMAQSLGLDQFAVETPFDVSWEDPEVRVAKVAPQTVEFTAGSGEIMQENWDAVMPAKAAEAIAREFELGWARFQGEAVENGAGDHTCRWLYKSITMDANGRILPCCGAPKPGVDVVFGGLNSDGRDEFNSEKYVQARRSFGDRGKYKAAVAAGGAAPYCANCEWNQEYTEFGPGEVAQYLWAVGRGSIDAALIEICGDW